MTIDEAIKHCLEVAEQKDHESFIDRWSDDDEWSESLKENCRQCAADHRQLAEWLKELKAARADIYNLLTKRYTSNCKLCKYCNDTEAKCYIVGGNWCREHAVYEPIKG